MDNLSNDPRWQAIVKKRTNESYPCDPVKNVECSKEVCAFRHDGSKDECTRTSRKEYSVDGSKLGDLW